MKSLILICSHFIEKKITKQGDLSISAGSKNSMIL